MQSRKQDSTVVVCTRNRASLLEITLESLAAQTLDPSRFEVLVVDNASTDSTPEVLARWKATGRPRCRHVVEEQLGLNHARNRGVREAGGDVIAFLDDDARAETEWLGSLLRALEEEGVAGVGGRIRLDWESRQPWWLTERHLLSLLAEFELGEVRCPVERFPYLVGTNMAFARDAFRRAGFFDLRFDRQGGSLLSMGDTEFCHRVVRAGGRLLYEPRAVVHHFVPNHRATLRFLVGRSYADGRSMARFHLVTGQRESGSRPRRFFQNLIAAAVRILLRDWARSAGALVFMARHLGYMRESRGL